MLYGSSLEGHVHLVIRDLKLELMVEMLSCNWLLATRCLN